MGRVTHMANNCPPMENITTKMKEETIMKKKLSLFLAVAMLAGLAAGCSPSGSAGMNAYTPRGYKKAQNEQNDEKDYKSVI